MRKTKKKDIKYILLVEREDGNELNIDKYPSYCPYCQADVEITSHISHSVLENKHLHLCLHCPRCKKLFVYEYIEAEHVEPDKVTGYDIKYDIFYYNLLEISQPELKTKSYDEVICNNFPIVIKILHESEKAEKFKLHELTGMGYRKALEYLIKEFIIKNLPQESEIAEVKKMALAAAINKYIDDKNIKELAKRAAWLGNDETHYERRWLEQNVNDLINLVNLTISYVSADLMGKRYIEDMPDKN